MSKINFDFNLSKIFIHTRSVSHSLVSIRLSIMTYIKYPIYSKTLKVSEEGRRVFLLLANFLLCNHGKHF